MMSQNLGKYRLIAMATVSSTILMISNATGNILGMEESNGLKSFLSNQENVQQTTISLNSRNLQAPQILKISAPNTTQLSGTIAINNRVIQKINNPLTQIDLSDYISTKGKYMIKISGVYDPAHASVLVEYSAFNKQISQTTGGNGKIMQLLAINVR